MTSKRNTTLSVILTLFKLIYRYPALLLIIFPVAGLNYLYEVKIARPAQIFQGVPKLQSNTDFMNWFRVLRNPHFMIGYSDLRSNPLWASYKINPVPKNAPHLKRPSSFKSDWRSLHRVKHKDYTGSGYDRGHMAPNYIISSLYGKQAQLNTFLMSNISPQRPNLNRKLWQRLEEVEAKFFSALNNNEVWVITGTVFKEKRRFLSSASHIQIPDALYKIYAISIQPHQAPKILAFLMPQNAKGYESLNKYLVTVDEIEGLTGLDFFSDLENNIENTVEANIEPKFWNLKAVANLKSRY